MIVDLVRNDLGRVSELRDRSGCPACWRVEHHPGLVHLVSTVEGRLRPGVGWAELLEATFPPGSVTGRTEDRRGGRTSAGSSPCPAGVVLRRRRLGRRRPPRGELNVAIRTFWFEDGELHLGTGGGITWDSTPGRRVGRDRAARPPACWRSRRRRADPRGVPMTVERRATVLDRRRGPGRAVVSPLDHGFLVGDGVFETLKTIDGRPFAPEPPPPAG